MRSRFTGRSVHRILGVLVVALAIGMVMSVAGSSATSASQTGNQAAFKKQFLTHIQQMQNVVTTMRATPEGRVALAQLKFDPSTNLTAARETVQRLTPAQLAVLQRAYSAYPQWRTVPSKLVVLVKRSGSSSRRSIMITPNDCATARAAGYTQTDIEIAADVALAADVVLEAVPQDVIGLPARLIAVALWAIPQGVLRGFEHLYNIANACDDEDFQTLVTTNLDVMVSTRASQTSLNGLITNFNTLSTLINTNLDVAVSTRASQASLTAFNAEFTANATVVNTKLDNIQTGVNTANTKLDAANGKLDTALVKLDTIITKIDQNAANDLRLKIEANLALPFGQAVVAFMIPEPNGHFRLARDIVLDSIQKMQAAGQGVGAAQTFFGQGETQRLNGNYKQAYKLYSNAYRSAAS